MIKYVICILDSLSSDFEAKEQLIYYLDKVIYRDIRDLDRNNYVLEVSPMLYEIMQKNSEVLPVLYETMQKKSVNELRYIERFMGILVSINENLAINQIRIKYERNNSMGIEFRGFGGIYLKNEKELPDKVIFNKKKKATTLLFDDDVVVVKQNKNDKEDYEKAFLWAYFIKKSGLSKTQASKYIDKIMEENK